MCWSLELKENSSAESKTSLRFSRRIWILQFHFQYYEFPLHIHRAITLKSKFLTSANQFRLSRWKRNVLRALNVSTMINDDYIGTTSVGGGGPIFYAECLNTAWRREKVYERLFPERKRPQGRPRLNTVCCKRRPDEDECEALPGERRVIETPEIFCWWKSRKILFRASSVHIIIIILKMCNFYLDTFI